MPESDEPAAKRARVEEVKTAHSQEEMLEALFHSWDRDGSGVIEFEEVLPHYMKAANHQELQETEVRGAFDKFMVSNGKTKKDGITVELFRKWLGKLTADQVANQYVRHVQGFTEKPYAMNLDLALDKACEGKSLKEILDSPISTIQGLTGMADDALAELNLKTVRDLGTWRFYLIARALVALAEKEDAGAPSAGRNMNIREALDRQHEAKSLKQVLNLHPSAFNMFPAKADVILQKLKVATIRSLGSRKTFAWANAMVELEKYEVHGSQ
eukprot:CAMPEP_0197889330 /NCGR_PEP_ID=MMETSP1439-20131203/24285_1 /TAXON_ID=66791 /ORGANISM="Gonyaulax spinifera, Strain CCMP409" /LENGTH=269 /DNA_ID=CAMNT_0043509303 /DNA_START=64 /DNA_END=873 /DNA_ORIENTATION=-